MSLALASKRISIRLPIRVEVIHDLAKKPFHDRIARCAVILRTQDHSQRLISENNFSQFGFVRQFTATSGQLCEQLLTYTRKVVAFAIGGGALPDLRRSAFTSNAEAFQEIVLEGALLDRGMAGFAEVLSSEDAEAIRAYLARQANL